MSRLFALPEWQAAADVPANADKSGKTGRGVPDVASLADPETPMWVLSRTASWAGSAARAPPRRCGRR